MPPIVSLCFANCNGMSVIDDCLLSVLAQANDLQVKMLGYGLTQPTN